jgi:hypothetical protein
MEKIQRYTEAKYYLAQESHFCPRFRAKIYFDMAQTDKSASNHGGLECLQDKGKG